MYSLTALPTPQPESEALTVDPRVRLYGVPFDALTQEETVQRVFEALDAGRGGWVVTSNLDHLRRAGLDPEFRSMLDEASLVVADGMPLVWASRLARTPLPERVAGSTMAPVLAEEAARQGRSVFLLGGNDGVAEAAAAVLSEEHPRLRIAGTHCPPKGFERHPEQMDAIRRVLEDSGADLVFVALGSPKQERLIRDLRDEGILSDAWWVGVGITLSFICGDVVRAPLWMQKTGLEWMHRLAQEPGRLARRYLLEGFPFACRFLTRAVIMRLRGPRDGEKAGPVT